MLNSKIIKKANPSEVYKDVKNCIDLYEWLKYRISDSKDRLLLAEVNKDVLNAALDGILFRVEMYDGTRLILKVTDYYGAADEILPELKKVIAPVIWNLGKDQNISGEHSNYRSEIISYRFKAENIFTGIKENVFVSAYDVKDAKQLILDVISGLLIDKLDISKISSKYPKFSYNDATEIILGAENKSFAESKFIEEIEKCSEFELYMYTKNVIYEIAQRIMDIKQAGGDTEKDKTLKNLQIAYGFLIAQAKRFGIFINDIPGMDILDTSSEYEAWYFWWDEAYNNLVNNHPEVLDGWKSLPDGYDENFRPSSSFDEFYELHLEILESDKRAKEEAERLQKLEKIAEVRDILKDEINNRKQTEERKKTPQGRAENFVNDILKKSKDNSISRQLTDFVTNTFD